MDPKVSKEHGKERKGNLSLSSEHLNRKIHSGSPKEKRKSTDPRFKKRNSCSPRTGTRQSLSPRFSPSDKRKSTAIFTGPAKHDSENLEQLSLKLLSDSEIFPKMDKKTQRIVRTLKSIGNFFFEDRKILHPSCVRCTPKIKDMLSLGILTINMYDEIYREMEKCLVMLYVDQKELLLVTNNNKK